MDRYFARKKSKEMRKSTLKLIIGTVLRIELGVAVNFTTLGGRVKEAEKTCVKNITFGGRAGGWGSGRVECNATDRRWRGAIWDKYERKAPHGTGDREGGSQKPLHLLDVRDCIKKGDGMKGEKCQNFMWVIFWEV